MAAFLEPLRKLSRRCRLSGTLQADEHDDRRRLRSKIQPDVRAAEHVDKFIAHDFDDLLPGRQALEYFFADRLCLHGIRELLHDLEIDVGFQQRHPDFLQGFVDVLGRQPALPAEVLEDAL